MATKFFFHDSTTTVTGTLPTSSTQSATAPGVTATGAGTNRSMDATIGTLQVAPTLASLALATTPQKNWFRRWVSPPIAAQDLTSTTWNYFFADLTSNATNSQFTLTTCFYLWRPSSGTRINVIADLVSGTTHPATASETGSSAGINASGSTITALNGDVLIFEAWATCSQAMATSYTWTLDYDGTTLPVDGTAISSAASYLDANGADIPLFTPSTFIAAKNRPILQAVNRATNWCRHQRRDSGLYVPRRRYFLPTSS